METLRLVVFVGFGCRDEGWVMIKRYEVYAQNASELPDGHWCKYSDVERFILERNAIAIELNRMRHEAGLPCIVFEGDWFTREEL